MTDDKYSNVDPAIIESLRADLLQQVMAELDSKDERERQARILEQKKDRETRSDYVARMKESKEPWVEIIGIEPTEQGIRTELDWNDAFIEYLKAEGIYGVDDDQVIQHYITRLMQDMVENFAEEAEEESAFE